MAWWYAVRDSNPRMLLHRRFSRPVPSTARPSLRIMSSRLTPKRKTNTTIDMCCLSTKITSFFLDYSIGRRSAGCLCRICAPMLNNFYRWCLKLVKKFHSFSNRYFRCPPLFEGIRTPLFTDSKAKSWEAPFLWAQNRAIFPQNFIRSFGRLFVGFVEAIK